MATGTSTVMLYNFGNKNFTCDRGVPTVTQVDIVELNSNLITFITTQENTCNLNFLLQLLIGPTINHK